MTAPHGWTWRRAAGKLTVFSGVFRMTIEGLAYRYLRFADQMLAVWPYPVLIAGFVAGFLWPSPPWRIGRGPHWVAWLLLLIVVNLQQTVWLQSFGLIRAGRLWLAVLAELAICLGGGFLAAWLAKARARDAFGRVWPAAIMLVPPVNLLLLAAPPARQAGAAAAPLPPGRLHQPAQTWVVLVLALGVINLNLGREIQARVATAAATPPDDAAFVQATAAVMIEVDGLEGYLDQVLAATEVPSRLDADLWLVAARREGRALIITYALSAEEGDQLADDYRAGLVRAACAAFGPALTAGARLEYHFQRVPARTEMDLIELRRADCFV